MKTKMIALLAIGPALMLAACDRQQADEPPPPTAADASATSSASAISGKGSGTVTALDKAAGKITIDHGPIAEAGWPAMTMAVDADPAMIGSVAVGDRVDFEIVMAGGTANITSIAPRRSE